MENDRIDVLAVMDRGVRRLNELHGKLDYAGGSEAARQLTEARAAVAELVETQRRMIEAFGLREQNPAGHATGALIVGPHQYEVVTDAMAAIARAQGGA